MRKQNDAGKKFFLRLCAALCVCLLCTGLLYPAPGYADEPEPTPRMIRRPARSPEPDPAEGLPVFVMVYYVNERGTVVREEKRRLTESCMVEADAENLPEEYELADSTAVYVLAENGTASPAYVEFRLRKKAQRTSVPAGSSLPGVFVPVYYVTDKGTVLCEGKVRITASGTIRADEEIVPEEYELTGETVREVRLENNAADPAVIEFTVRKKAAPTPFPSPAPKPASKSKPSPGPAAAPTPSVVHRDPWGTCLWEIDSSGMLTIYYGTGSDTGGKSPWEKYGKEIRSVCIQGKVVFPKDSSYLFSFSGEENLCTAISLGEADTSGVENMKGMFMGCRSLTTLDVSGFDTANAADMSFMFCECGGLTALNVSSFRTAGVTDMENMFDGCISLAALDVSGFDTGNVRALNHMFFMAAEA